MTAYINDLFSADDGESEEDIQNFDATKFSGAIVTDSDWTAETILSQLKKGNILLNPNFQRRDAWTDPRKSRFIESLFLGLPIPQIVLAESQTAKGKFIVIDGKQRLLSLLKFALNEAEPLKLTELDIRKDLNGKTFEALKKDVKFVDDLSAFENQTIRTTVIRGWKSEEVLFLIFFRLNSGSLPLSPQELRQVLHPGPFIDFAFKFSEECAELVELLGKGGKPDFRMRDVELVIRYFGFSFFIEYYSGDLKDFLDQTTLRLNESWNRRRDDIYEASKRLVSALNLTKEIFGDDAFRKWNGVSYERRFNRAVFDCMIFYFSIPDLHKTSIKFKQEIKKAFLDLCDEDPTFLKSIETTTKSSFATFYRLFKWGQTLEAILGIEIEELKKVEARLG